MIIRTCGTCFHNDYGLCDCAATEERQFNTAIIEEIIDEPIPVNNDRQACHNWRSNY